MLKEAVTLSLETKEILSPSRSLDLQGSAAAAGSKVWVRGCESGARTDCGELILCINWAVG